MCARRGEIVFSATTTKHNWPATLRRVRICARPNVDSARRTESVVRLMNEAGPVRGAQWPAALLLRLELADRVAGLVRNHERAARRFVSHLGVAGFEIARAFAGHRLRAVRQQIFAGDLKHDPRAVA